jgi:ABC-type lipoprotein export system ATPase subunit
MLTPEAVFVTDGFPQHTYVAFEAGSKEAELRDGLAQQNKIISISGPSKSGKTTLCNKVFGTDKGVSRI